MEQARKILNYGLRAAAGVSFLAMVIFTSWQVFTRYVLKQPSPWSEELVSYLFAWMALLGAALVAGERGHMNIPILIEKLSPALQLFFAILSELTAMAFSAIILVYGGVRITRLAMGQMTSSLGVPIGVFYIVLPLSGILIILYSILNMADILAGKTKRVARGKNACPSGNRKEQ